MKNQPTPLQNLTGMKKVKRLIVAVAEERGWPLASRRNAISATQTESLNQP